MFRVAIITATGLLEYTGSKLSNSFYADGVYISGDLLTLKNAVSIKSGRKLESVSFPKSKVVIEYIPDGKTVNKPGKSGTESSARNNPDGYKHDQGGHLS